MKHITDVISVGRTFHIFEITGKGDADGFWGIEDKYFGEDGKLVRAVNGVEGHHFQAIQETIDHVRKQIWYDSLIASGMDEVSAIKMVFASDIERAKEEVASNEILTERKGGEMGWWKASV